MVQVQVTRTVLIASTWKIYEAWIRFRGSITQSPFQTIKFVDGQIYGKLGTYAILPKELTDLKTPSRTRWFASQSWLAEMECLAREIIFRAYPEIKDIASKREYHNGLPEIDVFQEDNVTDKHRTIEVSENILNLFRYRELVK